MYDEARIIIAFGALLYATYHDIRTRHIPPWVWWPVGIAGLILYGIEAYQMDVRLLSMLLPLTGILIEALVDRGDVIDLKAGKINVPFLLLYILSAAGFAYAFMNLSSEALFQATAVAVLVSILYFFFYYRDILHGGADAKSLVMLSLLFPFYPALHSFPLITAQYPVALFLPFSFSVLFMASLFVAFIPIYFAILNTAKGHRRFPEMLLGYRMPVSEAREKKVWPMVRVVDGQVKRSLFPRKSHEFSWEELEEAGISEVWVTPKLPFILFIFLGFVFMVFIGNPLFLL